jgi:hypothetical protein
MTKEKNSTLTKEDKEALALMWRAEEEGHEQQAMEELFEWSRKWKHTDIAGSICGLMGEGGDRRRARGPAFDGVGIVLTVVFLEKMGMTEAAAKKEARKRYCADLRNVQLYVARFGPTVRAMLDFAVTNLVTGWEHNPSAGPRLTQEEIRKLNEITFREK